MYIIATMYLNILNNYFVFKRTITRKRKISKYFFFYNDGYSLT